MTTIVEDRLGADADSVYAALVQAHQGLTETQSARLNVRLVLLLANAAGDADLVAAAASEARRLTLATES